MTELDQDRFFAMIWPEKLLRQEFLELRTINRSTNDIKRKFFSSTSSLLQYAHQNEKEEIYFGVSTRYGQAGKKQDCFRTRTLWMDFDGKKLSEAIALSPKPDIVVNSGGGVHVYWLLENPVLIRNGAWERVEAINRGICKSFGGDITTIDVSRILRVPGFQNHKYSPARDVRAYAL